MNGQFEERQVHTRGFSLRQVLLVIQSRDSLLTEKGKGKIIMWLCLLLRAFMFHLKVKSFCKELEAKRTSLCFRFHCFVIFIVIMWWPFCFELRNTIQYSLINVALNIFMMSKVHHLLFFRYRETTDVSKPCQQTVFLSILLPVEATPCFMLSFPSSIFYSSFLCPLLSLSLPPCVFTPQCTPSQRASPGQKIMSFQFTGWKPFKL